MGSFKGKGKKGGREGVEAIGRGSEEDGKEGGGGEKGERLCTFKLGQCLINQIYFIQYFRLR